MKSAKYVLLFSFCWWGSSLAGAQPSIPKAIFVLVDGIPADVVEIVPTPYLDQIAQRGGYTRAYVGGEKGGYSESPTISAVGYNSLLTGTWANKHNVWGNGIENPNYHYWSIFRLMEEQYPQKKSAIFSTWIDNRTKLLGEGKAETGNLRLDYHFDGFEHDTVQFPHGEDREYIRRIDEHVAREAARYLREVGPDLSWVYLEYPDDMGHQYGDSEQLYRAVQQADRQIGYVWEAIRQREEQFDERWLIIVTTDHGRDQATGKNHGGQSARERTTWITTNAQDLNDYFHHDQPGIVDIMPTIARHLDIELPPARAREMDGVSLIGPVSFIQPKIKYRPGQITLSWTAREEAGSLQVWLSRTDNFSAVGEADEYTLIGEVPLTSERLVYELETLEPPPKKVVLAGPHNQINLWIPRP